MDAHSTLMVLTRLCQRRPEQLGLLRRALDGRLRELAPVAIEVALETGNPLGPALADCLYQGPDPELATEIHERIPDQTVSLRELAAISALQCVDYVTTRGGSRQTEAIVLNNLAARLLDVGQAEHAVTAARRAVELYRGEPDEGVGELRPGLAMCLNTLSVAWSEVGRSGEALDTARESVALYRRLATAEPDTRVLFAQSLNTLSNRLMALGRWREARAAGEEAREIYGGLPGSPYVLGELARCLDTLAFARLRCGLEGDALEASRQAADLYRYLAENDPDAFEPLLAGCLGNLAGILLRTGDPKSAEPYGWESLGVFSRLVSDNRPGAFGGRLLDAAIGQGWILHVLGRHSEAEQTLDSAMRMVGALDAKESMVPGWRYRRLWARHLAMSVLGAQGRFEEAIEQGERGIAECMVLPQESLDPLLPELARCGQSLAATYLESGSPGDALRALEEARGVYLRLREIGADEDPEGLLGVLRPIAELSMSLGDIDRAFRAIWESVILYSDPGTDGKLTDEEREALRQCFAEQVGPQCTDFLVLLKVLTDCVG